MAVLTREQIKKALDAGVSPEQIKKYQEKGSIAEKPGIKDLPGNIIKSGGRAIKDIGGVILNPIETVKGLGSVALGGVEKLLPGEQKHEQTFDAVVDFYKDRYGSLEKAKEAFFEDPVGVALDVSGALAGGGALLSRLGRVGKAAEVARVAGTGSRATRTANIAGAAKSGEFGRLAQTGAKIGEIGRKIDPLTQTLKGTGKLARRATEGRRIAPFSKGFESDVAKTFERADIEVPTSAVTDSRAVPLIESSVEKGLFGGRFSEKIDRASSRLNDIADNLVQSINENTDLSSIGQNIADSTNNYRNNFIKLKNQLFGEAKIPIDSQITEPTRTTRFLDLIIGEERRASKVAGKDSKLLKFYEGVRDGLKDPKLTARELNAFIDKTSKRLVNFSDPITRGDPATLKKLFASLNDDLFLKIDELAASGEIRPDLLDDIKKARNLYQQGLLRMESAYARKILRLADAKQYDKILPAIFNRTMSAEDIPRIFEVIGPENVPGVRAALLEDIFTKARSKVDDSLLPTGITRQINSFGESKLRRILTEDQFRALKDIETMSKALGKGLKIAKGSQTAFIIRMLAPLQQLFTGNILQALGLVIGDAAASKFIASPAGQQLLREGLELKGTVGKAIEKTAPKVGGRGRTAFQARAPQQTQNENAPLLRGLR